MKIRTLTSVFTLSLSLLFLLQNAGHTASPSAFGVCPFQNLNNNKEYGWVADGIADSISNDMKTANLVVVERLQLKDAIKEISLGQSGLVDEKTAAKTGKLVGAAYLVMGSYQIFNNQIRIIAKIITTETGVVSNAAKVTGRIDAIFSLQDELFLQLIKGNKETAGQAVALNNAQVIQEIKKKPTGNLDAYKYYLLSEEYNHKAANRDHPRAKSFASESINYGLKAVQIDPGMSTALSCLAHGYENLRDHARAVQYLERAVKSLHAGTDAITKNEVLAYYEYFINKNFDRAINYYQSNLTRHQSNIVALWQLWAIYRGAWGSTRYNLAKSNQYGNLLVYYHPKSVLAGYIRHFSTMNRIY